MADSAPKIAEKEQYESADEVDRKAQILADRIRKSKHFIAFTGAGVSTSAGIPDFRGPEGAWTLRAQGRERTGKSINTLQAIPTPAHMALVELQNRGYLKYLVSQNCDGLHRRSGITPDKISEVHGNSNRESCKDCGKEYIRDFRAVATYEKSVHDHRTGRKCTACGGILLDSIVNFGDDLPIDTINKARANARKSDLCLVLGSSLTVTPARDIPGITGKKKGADFVICNLQSTPLDNLATLRVFTNADILMGKVMEKLGLTIPKFILRRRLVVELETKDGDRHRLSVYGVDVDGTPVTFIRTVKCEYNRRGGKSDPFIINFREHLDIGTKIKLELEFMGNYGEPNLEVEFEYTAQSKSEILYLLEYNPQRGAWNTTNMGSDVVGGGNQGDVVLEKEIIDLTID